LTPAAYAAGLRSVMASVDAVTVEDGASEGSGRTPAQIASIFQPLSSSFASGPQLWDDPDMYGLNGGPLPPAGLVSDLQAVCGLASFVTGFSFPSQLDPLNGETAQYNAYQSYEAG